MRTVFNRVLVELAAKDPRIFLVVADIGWGEVERFAETFPDRFYNVGVAEQNMTGVACGLALEGNIPVTYTIGNFVFVRCLEQIRNDVCYHKANVKIVIVGGGMRYGALGVSHHATEDIAIMRSLPNLVLVCPCDLVEAEAATRAIMAHEGPVAFRCGRKGEPQLHPGPVRFEIGKSIRIREGRDAALLFTGTIGNQVLPAAEELARQGIHCRVVSMHTVKPIHREAILSAAEETGAVVTVEEHQMSGGFGSAVAEVLCDAGVRPRKFLRLALPDEYVTEVGGHPWLLEQYGLSATRIAERVRRLLG